MFPLMAFARQMGFYTLLITYWIHFKQLGLSFYLGILGFFLIYFTKFIGVCIVRNCMSNQIPKTRGNWTDYSSRITPSFGRRSVDQMDYNSSHTQIMVGSNQERCGESPKTNMIIANVLGLISAGLFLCFSAKMEINGTLLMSSFIFFGLW